MLRSMPEMMELLLNPENPVNTVDDHVCRLKMALYENVWNKHCVNKMYYWLYDAILMYIYKLERYVLEGPIFIRDRETSNMTKPGDRMWFRKIEGKVELEVTKQMSWFNNWYDGFVERIKLSHTIDSLSILMKRIRKKGFGTIPHDKE